MALTRRSVQRMSGSIWPGFVDAMTALLLVLMFVLTIFMVVQFMLRETISGQETELDELTAEVTALAEALGLEQQRSFQLENQVSNLGGLLESARSRAEEQTALIANLTQLNADQADQLDSQAARISSFEAQVASLLAERDDALARGDALAASLDEVEAANARLITEQEALNLALAQARDEIDAQAEAARLAAARREALDALVADLQSRMAENETSLAALQSALDDQQAARIVAEEELANLQSDLSEAERARLAEAAAAEALRARLADAETQLSEEEKARLAEAAAAARLREELRNANDELTAMTLALEERRREAEETLTLLAAARAVEIRLNEQIAAALLAQDQLQNRLDATVGGLDSTEAQLERARADLATALQQKADAEERARLAIENAGEDASRAAELETRLAAALLLQQDLRASLKSAEDAQLEAEARAQSVEQRLIAALSERDDLSRQSQQDALTRDDMEARLASLEAALAAMTDERNALQDRTASNSAEVQNLTDRLKTSEEALAVALAEAAALKAGLGDRDELRRQLAAALAAKLAAEQANTRLMSEAEQRAVLLSAANDALSDEEAKSAESQRRLAVLNEQVAALRAQLGTLEGLLEAAEQKDRASRVEITNLGARLNAALARVASEERQRAALEEAERVRLEEEARRLAEEARRLERYRSDFFGQMREVLADREGVQIVGDRFVFSSEVLFEPASAELSDGGREQIARVAELLGDVSQSIPPEIDWVIRVDGHTDRTPLSGTGRYSDNWELSQARALSVVRYMTDQLGFPANRLAATGFGEFQPVDDGDTPEALARNRRIELKLTER